MPKITGIHCTEDNVVTCTVKLDHNTDVLGPITLWTNDEIEQFKQDCVRDFLVDLFEKWKDHQ